MSLRKRFKGNKIHNIKKENVGIVKERNIQDEKRIAFSDEETKERGDRNYDFIDDSSTNYSINKMNKKRRRRGRHRNSENRHVTGNTKSTVFNFTSIYQQHCTYQVVIYSIVVLLLINYSSYYYKKQKHAAIHKERVRRLMQLNISGRKLMSENAKIYQNKPDPQIENQKIDEFRYWAQDIGLSYFEYYRGRYYTPKESEGLAHSQCFSWPGPRTQFTFLAISTQSTFTGSGNLIMKPYALAYGGLNGGVKDDMWLFIRGLIDGTQMLDTELQVIRKFAFMAKNLDGDTLAQSCESKNVLQCNRCGRWHKLNPKPEGRGITDCRYFQNEIDRSLNQEKATLQYTQWCPDLIDRYIGKSLDINIGRFAHVSTFMYRDTGVMSDGIMVTFGGETKTSLSNSVWYLAKLPIPSLPTNAPAYMEEMSSEFLCMKVYASDEVYPPRRICPKNNRFVDMKGELHSGKLLPQTECLWIIEPNITSKNYIIVLDVQRLDLANPPFTCESYVTITDTSNVTAMNEYNVTTGGTVLFHGCSTKIMPTTRFAGIKGKMVIKMYYENMCPSHSGFDANYTVREVEDGALGCEALEKCSGHGECQAGICFCVRGYFGATCDSTCNPRDKDCIKNGLQVEEVIPQPRSGHVAVHAFKESYTKVAHRTYSRQISDPVRATADDLISAQGDIAKIYAQDCCKCHDRPNNPCTVPDRETCEGDWIEGCTWDPHFTMQRKILLQRELQSFQCSATKAPARDSQGKAQNKLSCEFPDSAEAISGRTDAIRMLKREITSKDGTVFFPEAGQEEVCRSTWQFPDKFKLAFDCVSKKAEIDAQPQLRWGEAWSDSRICKNTTDWIPQNAIAEEVEEEFLRAFGQDVKVTINLGYSVSILSGGEAKKEEQLEWHDSVNFGGGCTGQGEIPCQARQRCSTDGHNSRVSVFCDSGTKGTPEYNQQCVCENSGPIQHLPEVCSKTGSNVVTIEFKIVPECHGLDAKLPFCDMPHLYMTERESDLTIAFLTDAQAASDCQYEAKHCGCDCKKNGISPYYVIMKGNKSREVFYNDITQEVSSHTDSHYAEMNQSRLVNDSFWTEPIRVERSQIDFIMPEGITYNSTAVLRRDVGGSHLCSEVCAYICADKCPDGSTTTCSLPSTISKVCGSNISTGCGYDIDKNCYIAFWDAWECGFSTSLNCYLGPQYHTPYSYEKFLILEQFYLRDTIEEDGIAVLQGNKTATKILSDSYESNSSTWGEGAQMVMFGGWNGNNSLNDLWTLSVQEQLGNAPLNRSCKTKIVSTGNSYELIQVPSTEYVIRPRFGFEVGDIDYMPCSNINWTKHAFFPNFHKINKWRKIDETITGAPPAPRYFHTVSKFGNYEQGDGYSKDRYRMLVFGGFSSVDGRGRNDLWELTLPARNQDKQAFKWTEVKTDGDIPRKRWQQAMSTLKRDSGNYLFVYGGWDGQSVLNDMYMITLDSPYNTTLIWKQFGNTRGSWHMTHFAIPFLPFDSLAGLPGFKGYHVVENELPIRYGHAMISLTSTFDGINETRDVLMSWSGALEKEMSRGLNTDIYGLFWGGKATAGYYICPDVDVACAHPTYKGVGSLTFSYNSLRVSHILAFVLFLFTNYRM